MAVKITIGDEFKAFTFTNIYDPTKEPNVPFIDPLDGKDWNTGLSAAGEPHADENYDYAGQGLIDDTDAYAIKKIAAIRLFKTNQEVVLNPGDSLEITPTTKEEVLYYLSFADSDVLQITGKDEYITEVTTTETTETTTTTTTEETTTTTEE